MTFHIPVLLNKSVDLLVENQNGIYFDATAGFGGHTNEILKKLSYQGKVIATDKDFFAFTYCQDKFKHDKRYSIYNTSFVDIDSISKIEFIEHYDGILADLGVSSYQLDSTESGFTFRDDTALDLRMNKKQELTAEDVVNNFSEDEISNILLKYGEEKNAKKIARKIIELRNKERISKSSQLKALIEKITPQKFVIKTLTRVFLALRLYVNNELDELKAFLDKAVTHLKSNGRIVVLTYHSLEDRIVKEKFKYESLKCICPPGTPVCICSKKQRLKLIGKTITPTASEKKENRRSRSAKLRFAEKV